MVKELSGNFFEEVKEGFTFVDFYANWCGPCMMMSPVVDEVSEEFKDLKFLKVNVDKYGDVAMNYRISTIPRFIIFKDGEIYKTKIGAMSKDELVCYIKDSIK